MDEHTKLHLAQQLEANEWFQLGFDEAIERELKKMELANPNQPEVLVQANISLRAIKLLRETLLKPATPKRIAKEK